MAKKALAYILILIGIIAIAYYAVPQINATIKPSVPEGVTDTHIIVGGIIVFLIGVYLLSKGKRHIQKGYEVPIYHGGNVVGYRRN